jgi:hypothetical protein
MTTTITWQEIALRLFLTVFAAKRVTRIDWKNGS